MLACFPSHLALLAPAQPEPGYTSDDLVEQALLWGGFIAFILCVVVFDLFFVGKRHQEIKPAKALVLTGIFVGMGLLFAPVLFWIYSANLGHVASGITGGVMEQPGVSPGEAVAQYLQAWLLEYSLSVDNLFIFTLVFTHFKVEKSSQHRVLFWGIIGALVFRGLMIAAGAALISAAWWVLYLFAAILLYTAIKLAFSKDDHHIDFDNSRIVRLVRRLVPLTTKYDGDRFFLVEAGKRFATPLLIVLVIIESTDIVFALDSIPAAFGVTREPFIVFAANMFAIMGLRSLYFALAGLMNSFSYLKYSLAAVLGFIAVKMLIAHEVSAIGFPGYPVPTWLSLSVIVIALAAGIVASIIATRRKNAAL
ncbi:TerC family protein [soil metagenome]